MTTSELAMTTSELAMTTSEPAITALATDEQAVAS